MGWGDYLSSFTEEVPLCSIFFTCLRGPHTLHPWGAAGRVDRKPLPLHLKAPPPGEQSAHQPGPHAPVTSSHSCSCPRTHPSFPCGSDSVLEGCVQTDILRLSHSVGPKGLTQSPEFPRPAIVSGPPGRSTEQDPGVRGLPVQALRPAAGPPLRGPSLPFALRGCLDCSPAAHFRIQGGTSLHTPVSVQVVKSFNFAPCGR